MPRSRRPLPVVLALTLLAAGAAVVLGSGAATATTGAVEDSSGPPESSSNEHHDVSDRLRDTPSKPWTNSRHIREHATIPPAGTTAPRRDGALQGTPSTTSDTPTVGIGFQGVGNGLPGFVVNSAPPDTTGAAGATQYVQWVNESFAVFNKSDGTVYPGFPKTGRTLWAGFGGGCEANNDGDPIVQYDKAAGRWVLTQFSVTSPTVYGYLQCVAVSRTSDATGTYDRYSFSYGKTAFNDYPKVGIWPDAYYVTYNIFNNGTTFAGAKVCALDRNKMLAGLAAAQVCFQTSTAFGGLLPSDADGSTSPGTTPQVVAAFGNNRIDRWLFKPNFAAPSSSTFTQVAALQVNPFTAACGGGGTCIPQVGTTQQLDSLADRLMYRLVYRVTPAGPRWLVTHSVTAGASVGVRWYELTSLDATPSVVHSGTYAPDADYRWMSSAAMDQKGNIAVGYSLSGPTRSPTIAFSTRSPTDLNDQLSNETFPLGSQATGSQTANLARWGDYSTMTVDPVDDCTFWYSTEYLESSGTFNWSTWITSFKLPSCVPTPQPPGAPSGLTASAGDTSIALSWTAPAPGSQPITSYDVFRDTFTTPYASSATTDYTDSGLTFGETHSYTVRAVNRVGPGPQSSSVTATAGTPRAPGAPTGLTATGGVRTAALSWTAPADLGNPAATAYSIWRRTGGSTAILVTSQAGTTFTDSGLASGTTYVYSVAANTSNGDGARSAEASATTANVPGAPSLTASTAVAPAVGVALSWTTPANNGSPITGYHVYRRTGSGTQALFVTLGTVTTYNDSATVSGQRYFYQVDAINAVGIGQKSTEQRARAR